MVAQFFDTLFKLAEQYKNEEKKEKDPTLKKLAHERYQNANFIIDILDAIWQKSERRKIELHEVMPLSVEDELILGINGLRIFKDDADGHIFYELERRHFDTEKEIISEVIRQYNRDHDYIKRKKRSLVNGYSELTPVLYAPEWTRQDDGGYERIPLPTRNEA